MFNMKAVQPSRLDADTKFRFECHKGVKCFTRCCSNIDIMLTPYDVVRMKKRLGMSSEEFIIKYTVMKKDEKSSHPYAYLKMSGDEERRCPFLVVPDGCTIYEDRPVSCRYYPIGQATLKKTENDQVVHDEFYFFIKEEHCLGYKESKEWTIASWRQDQGSEHFDEMNREWKELLMRRNMPGKAGLDTNKQDQFFMASYDMDRFRRFVFESRFLDVFDIPADDVEAMRTDDVVLMKLAFRYIKYVLMMEQSLKIKTEALQSKKDK